MPGLQIENYRVWYEICSVRGEKNAALQRIRKYELDKTKAQNYVTENKSTEKMFESVR